MKARCLLGDLGIFLIRIFNVLTTAQDVYCGRSLLRLKILKLAYHLKTYFDQRMVLSSRYFIEERSRRDVKTQKTRLADSASPSCSLSCRGLMEYVPLSDTKLS